jgi:MADS-box transcription factor
MGRGKTEIKRIDNAVSRQVTFGNRKAGLLKKARELAVLCDADVGVLVFSAAGQHFDYCSPYTRSVPCAAI